MTDSARNAAVCRVTGENIHRLPLKTLLAGGFVPVGGILVEFA